MSPGPDPLTLLADPTRREIVRLVWDVERSAGEIAARFSTTFGAVSQHLAKLREAGVLTRRRDGRRLFYRADRERLGPLAAALEQMWMSSLTRLAALAEAEQRAIDRTTRRSTRHDPSRRRSRRPPRGQDR